MLTKLVVSMIPVNNNIVCIVIGTTGEMESYSRAICGREKLQPSSVLKRGYVGGDICPAHRVANRLQNKA